MPADRADETTDIVSKRLWWRRWLGAEADPDGSWRLGELRKPGHPDVHDPIRKLVISSFGSELTCDFYRPTDVPPSGLVVILPFYDTPSLFGDPTARTRRTGRNLVSNAHAVHLAAAGHAILAVPWWFEQVAATNAATAEAHSLTDRYGPAAERHRREHAMTALGRSVGDLMLAVTAVKESGLAESDQIAAFGHSLGAKLTLHLAALDKRIEIAAAHEGGLGLDHSNWSDPWYLDGAVPGERDHDELLGLVAPRPFLLAGGGDGDGVHTLELVRRAAAYWPESSRLEVLFHNGGHALPLHVMAGIRDWLRGRSR